MSKYILEQHVQTYDGIWHMGTMGEYKNQSDAERDREQFESIKQALINSGHYRDVKYNCCRG